jgi:IS605 OrfB family transposase
VKLVVQVKLLPTPEQEQALAETLRTCNEAANWVSKVAFSRKCFRNYDLRRLSYLEIKTTFGLSAAPAQHVIKKVADAYVTLRGSIRAGRLGRPGTKRRDKAESRPVTFRPGAAQTYDDLCLSWQYERRTVSILTTAGRMKHVSYTGSPEQLSALERYRQGESDLVQRDGKWFLYATCDVAEAPLNTHPTGWVGVDRGIVNLATTSDGKNFCGKELTRYRRRQARLRAELQAKGTKSARRKLRRRAKREARHAAHVNHVIAKEIVADAERTGRGIALEDLKGIRDRGRLNRHQRAALSNWPFRQLGECITYKGMRAGVPVLEVDPAYTSQTCPACGHTERGNRPDRDTFRCRSCGFAGPADHVAALNVERRASVAWVFVNMPHAAVSPSPSSGSVTSGEPAAASRG